MTEGVTDGAATRDADISQKIEIFYFTSENMCETFSYMVTS